MYTTDYGDTIENDIYVCHFSNGLREGPGTVFYSNGDIYQGTWLKGSKNGCGLLIRNGKIEHQYYDVNGKKITKEEAIDIMKITKHLFDTGFLSEEDYNESKKELDCIINN